MGKKIINELNEKIKELEEKCERLQTYIDFGIVMEHSDYNMQSPYYESNVAMEETVNKMIHEGCAKDCTFNNTFNVRYFCNNLYRKGYRKIKE